MRITCTNIDTDDSKTLELTEAVDLLVPGLCDDRREAAEALYRGYALELNGFRYQKGRSGGHGGDISRSTPLVVGGNNNEGKRDLQPNPNG